MHVKIQVKRKSAIADCVARAQSSTSRVTGSSPVQRGKAQGTKESSAVAAPSKKGSGVKQSDSSAEVGDVVHAAVVSFDGLYRYVVQNTA